LKVSVRCPNGHINTIFYLRNKSEYSCFVCGAIIRYSRQSVMLARGCSGVVRELTRAELAPGGGNK
jgi:ribosomal protein S27E